MKLIASSQDTATRSVNAFWSFDPLKGFIFRNSVTWDIIGHYECRSRNHGNVELHSSIFEVDVYGRLDCSPILYQVVRCSFCVFVIFTL